MESRPKGFSAVFQLFPTQNNRIKITYFYKQLLTISSQNNDPQMFVLIMSQDTDPLMLYWNANVILSTFMLPPQAKKIASHVTFWPLHLIVRQIKSKFQDNRSLCDTSTKFGMNNA